MTTDQRPLKILIAGGGTGGHVLPAVAVVEEIRNRELPVEFLWIGSHTGVEQRIAKENNLPFVAIQTGKLRRYLSIKTFTDAVRVPVGILQAYRHIRKFKPDVMYSTGGAFSVPSVIAGSRLAPILTHEQTAQIGLANKTAARFADTFAVGFEATAALARQRHQHVVVTGNPVRMSLKTGVAQRGYETFRFTPDLPVLFVTGGALGASPLNQRIEPLLPDLLQTMQIVHQVGPLSANDDFTKHSALREGLPTELRERYVVKEFLSAELPDLYAITDLVIGRAGAGTVSELAFMGLPSILIPLPGTWGDEQTKNGKILADLGASVVLPQPEATPERLQTEITAIMGDPARRAAMKEAASNASRGDAASNLVDELLKLVRG